MLGTFERPQDTKSRVTLPKEFREELGNTVVLVPVRDVLYGFTPDGFKAWVDGLFEYGEQSFNPHNLKDVRLKRYLYANAREVDVDSAGRIALGKLGPKALAALGFGRNLVVNGCDDHFEVWDAEAWERENAEVEEDVFDLMFTSGR